MCASQPWVLLTAVLAGALTFGSSARAGELSVDTLAPAPSGTCKGAYVQADALDEGIPSASRLRRAAVGVPGRVTFELPAGTWRVTLKGDRCLGNYRIVRVQSGSQAIRLSAWPAAVLTGRLVVPQGHDSPTDLLLTFAPAHRLRQGGNPQGKGSCTVERGGKFRCMAPATRLDLRLSTRGYAAAYSWDAELAAARPKDLGQVRLVPGGSLAGWVSTSDGSALPRAVRIGAAPSGLSHATTPQEERLLKLTTAEAAARQDGFFHLTGLQGGDYELSFRAAGFAEAKAAARVTAGREARLRDPVILTPPLKLSIVVDPPVAPGGRPWRILIGATDRYRSHLRPIAEATVPANGWYEKSGLNAGPYRVKLLSPNGAGWATREVDLGSEPMPVTIEVGAVRVGGEVTLGDESLAGATIWFGGRSGAEKVELRTDEDGHYETVLPRAGTWKVDLAAADPVVNRRFPALEVPLAAGGKAAALDIHLADTKLSGELRMRDGSPIDHAAVRIWPVHEGLWTGVVTHRVEGDEFSVRGLAEGSYFVNADSGDSRASSQLVSLSEDDERHVVLILDRYAKVSGRVMGDGHPVSGALVILQPLQDLAFIPRSVYTDADGRFEVDLPRQTSEVVAQLAAPGRTYAAFRVGLSDDALLFEIPGHGGDLSLDLEPGLTQLGGESILLVFRDGAPLELGTLLNWARLNPGEDASGADVLMARSLAAGHYEACSVPKGAFVTWIRGARDPNRCAGGNLSALGTLHLRVPRKESGSTRSEP